MPTRALIRRRRIITPVSFIYPDEQTFRMVVMNGYPRLVQMAPAYNTRNLVCEGIAVMYGDMVLTIPLDTIDRVCYDDSTADATPKARAY